METPTSQRKPHINRVARRWTLSSWLMLFISVKVLASIAKCRCSRAMAQYNGIKADEDNSVKDRRKGRAIDLQPLCSALTMQKSCQGSPLCRMTMIDVCLGEKTEKVEGGSRHDTHEHMVELIGRSRSQADHLFITEKVMGQ